MLRIGSQKAETVVRVRRIRASAKATVTSDAKALLGFISEHALAYLANPNQTYADPDGEQDVQGNVIERSGVRMQVCWIAQANKQEETDLLACDNAIKALGEHPDPDRVSRILALKDNVIRSRQARIVSEYMEFLKVRDDTIRTFLAKNEKFVRKAKDRKTGNVKWIGANPVKAEYTVSLSSERTERVADTDGESARDDSRVLYLTLAPKKQAQVKQVSVADALSAIVNPVPVNPNATKSK